MVVSAFIQSKLASKLRPFLQDDPDFSLQLGFLSSHFTFKNLRFDTSALGVDDSALQLKKFSVGELRVRVSPFSKPSVVVDVSAVNAVLAPRENSGKRKLSAMVIHEAERKKVISTIDPEGHSMHEMIAKLLAKLTSVNLFLTSSTNILLKCCQVRFHDTQFHLELIEDKAICTLKMNYVSIEPEPPDCNSLLRGAISLILKPGKESTLAISCGSTDLLLKDKDWKSKFISSSGISARVSIRKNLQFQGLDFDVPNIKMNFSPITVAFLMIALYVLSPKGYDGVRNGREMWKVARYKVGHLLLPKHSFQRVVTHAMLWSKYICTYENLLLLLGYSAEVTWKENVARVCNDLRYFDHVKHQWMLANELEEKLPAKAVAVARQIARYRVATHPSSANLKSTFSPCAIAWSKFFVENVIVKMFLCIIHNFLACLSSVLKIFGCQKLASSSTLHSDSYSNDLGTVPNYLFTLANLSITFFPATADQCSNDHDIAHEPIGNHLKLPSLCIVITSLCIICSDGLTRNSLFVAFGELKMCLSFISRSLLRESVKEFRGGNPSFNMHRDKDDIQSKTVLQSEPSSLYQSSSIDSILGEDGFKLVLEKSITDLWLNWKKLRTQYLEQRFQHTEYPFLLCHLQSFLFNPYESRGDYGLQRCNLTLGKLNLDLDYPSILAVSLLCSHFYSHWTTVLEGFQCASSGTSVVDEEKLDIGIKDIMMWHTTRMRNMLLKVKPYKSFQIGALISGLKIQIWLRKSPSTRRKEHSKTLFDGVNRNFCFILDLGRIEVAMWPASKTVITALKDKLSLSLVDVEHNLLKDFSSLKISDKKESDEYFYEGRFSHNACLSLTSIVILMDDLEFNQHSHIVGPASVNILSTSCRDYYSALSATSEIFSISLSGIVTGAAVCLYVDQLLLLFQEISSVQTDLDSVSGFSSEDFARTLVTSSMKELKSDFMEFSGGDEYACTEIAEVVLDVDFLIESVDIIVIDSWKDYTGFLSSGVDPTSAGSSLSVPSLQKEPTLEHMPTSASYGIGAFVKNSCIRISSKDDFLEMLVTVPGIRAVVYNHQSAICTRIGQMKDLLDDSMELHQFIITNLKLKLQTKFEFDYPSSNTCYTADVSSDTNSVASEAERIPHLDAQSEIQLCQSDISLEAEQSYDPFRPVIDDHLCHDTCRIATSWTSLDIELDEIFISQLYVKKMLRNAHQPNGLKMSFSFPGDLQRFRCKIEGGFIFVEASALVKFFDNFETYIGKMKDAILMVTNVGTVSSAKSGQVMVSEEILVRPAHNLLKENISASDSQPERIFSHGSYFMETLGFEVCQLSLVFAIIDESGGIRELIAEVDLNLQLTCFGKQLNFSMSRFALRSQHLENVVLNEKKESLMHHFHSGISELPSSSEFGIYFTPEDGRGMYDGHVTAQHTSDPVTCQETSIKNAVSDFSMNDDSYMLQCLTVSVELEKIGPGNEVNMLFRSIWAGIGSISGFNLTMTLSEIQFLLVLIESFSGMGSSKSNLGLASPNPVTPQEIIDNQHYEIPDGAIVAIQDVDQHMYVAVELINKKYTLVGSLHYSLVGQRALFRVNYHRGWRSKACFSLVSLFAENHEGMPLFLNSSARSDFVEISSSHYKQGALWEAFLYRPEILEDIDYAESCRRAYKNAFQLVNKRNNCGVAFADGLLEFVKRPGNPFKAKVFSKNSIENDAGRFSNYLYGTFDNQVQGESSGTVARSRKPQHVTITVDKIVITVAHQESLSNEKIPLLHGCINETNVVGEILPSKFRIISSFTFSLHHFDAQRRKWFDIVSPIESSFFFRSKSANDLSVKKSGAVPVHCFFHMKQIDISITQISLDVILYFLGKLDLSGPYAVRTSAIFPNCCKVINNSALNLHCHFAGSQDIVVAGKQTTSVFVRHALYLGRPSEKVSSVVLSLTKEGAFTTLPINISLFSTSIFAWRARVMSLKDSRNFPGPLIVVEVSKSTEGGISLIVSPLLRIHNRSMFPIELRFQRPQEIEGEAVYILLRNEDTIDDLLAAFDATELSGASKKALLSISLGNYLLSIRPDNASHGISSHGAFSVSWSENLTGEKAVRVSGVLDMLNYKFRKALGINSMDTSFSLLHCPISTEEQHFSDMHFLIKTVGREVPIMQPPNKGDASGSKRTPVALQVQKEIFIYPTVQICNFLQLEVNVFLSETSPDSSMTANCNNFWKQAVIPRGSNAYFYVDPSIFYLLITLPTYNISCKPVNSGELVKKLNKQKIEVDFLDTGLNFGGKCFATLRLSHSETGVLQVYVFTKYTLQNMSEVPLFSATSDLKILPWVELNKSNYNLSPELGCYLPPKSMVSWFSKSSKVYLKPLTRKASTAVLDLDLLSGFTEVSFETEDDTGASWIEKLGISVQSSINEVSMPSNIVSLVPRFVIYNESEEAVILRQCYLQLQDHIDEPTYLYGKQKMVLKMRRMIKKRKEASFLESIIKRHRNDNEDSHIYFQFCPKDDEFSWSGPICIASLGRFFLKFRKSQNSITNRSTSIPVEETSIKFASIHIVEENSSLVLHYIMPPNSPLPYRIENLLHDVSILYYQKGSNDSDILVPGNSTDYIWDDSNLPHKLVIEVVDMHLLREISIEKVCKWKPLFKMGQSRGLVSNLPFDKGLTPPMRANGAQGFGVFQVGYEVYADGMTRILRICEQADCFKEDKILQPDSNFQLRISGFALHFLEDNRQDVDDGEMPVYSPIIVARLAKISLDTLVMNQYKYNCAKVQIINVEEKWPSAPFASMIRKSQLNDSSDEPILQIIFILHQGSVNVRRVKYSSIVLQPIDVRVDEETLLRLVSFWRSSLSDSQTPSRQFYFEHFEIHPIKVTASFLPGNPYASYTSAQEALRSLLHSVIKVPALKNKVVELNGVLLTHALVTSRELLLKCAQHYSWYGLRAIYLAKGSQLLPPAFASVFDDTAASSLDVFFDPSDGSINLPGLSLGMFKFVSKCLNAKDLSGTKRYLGDLGKSIRTAGSNVLFAAVTEISDNVLKGAETSGLSGMVNGFHQGIMRLAMEPALLGTAVLEGGPDRKIKLDHSPGVDELYIEGYIQAMLDVMYKQEYLRVRVIDDQVILKNLPPNSSVINEIVENVKSFLVSRALLKGDASTDSRPLRHLRNDRDWKLGPTVLTLFEHLFVGFAIRILRKQACKVLVTIPWKPGGQYGDQQESTEGNETKPNRIWTLGKFVLSGTVAYLDGRLCRHIPNPIARRIVSGFLLSFLDNKYGE